MTSSRDIGRLLDIMAALRTPQTGCPWDLAQNFSTIAPYTLEEAYEVADAIARGDLADLREELGDLLLQVVFHARMAQEQGAFDFGDVVVSITEKLIRRHPHVFGDERAAHATGRRGPMGAHQGAGESGQSRAERRQCDRRRSRRRAGDAARPHPRAEIAESKRAKSASIGTIRARCCAKSAKKPTRSKPSSIAALAMQRVPLPKPAICYSPRSIWCVICVPTRKRCCGQPTANSNAVSPPSSARLRPRKVAGRGHARRNGCAVG